MIYPLTSVFRTGIGPYPVYKLVPVSEYGEFELARPFLLLSNDTMHAVTKVRVHQYVNFVILQSMHHWAALPDGLYTENVEMSSLIGFKPRMLATEHRIPLNDILNTAMLAAMYSGGMRANTASKLIDKLLFYEFRTEPLKHQEYAQGMRFTLPIGDMTEKQLRTFLYGFLCVSFRIYRLKVADNDKKTIRLAMGNTFWRDFILVLLMLNKVRYKVTIRRDGTFVHITQESFCEFIRKVFTESPDMPYRDFKMAYTLMGKHVVVVSDSTRDFITSIDTIADKSVERVMYTVATATCTGVSFPEISGVIEHNSTLLKLE